MRDAIEVLLHEPRLVVVAKPAGLPTIPSRDEPDCVASRLAAQLGIPFSGESDPRIRVVHRLDRGTSGVLLFATDVETQRHLSGQFEHGRVQKVYLALCRGAPPAESGEIDAPIGPHPRRAGVMAIRHDDEGKPAHTRWRVAERFAHLTLIEAMPATGRTHQIRVHLASIGLPLAIDPRYGSAAGPPGATTSTTGRGDALYLSEFKRGYKRAGGAETPLMARLTLHAAQLTFTDGTGAVRTVAAELPKDFRITLQQLRRHDAS